MRQRHKSLALLSCYAEHTLHNTLPLAPQRYKHLFDVNEKHGSFYLQSKVYRAWEALDEDYTRRGVKPPGGEGGGGGGAAAGEPQQQQPEQQQQQQQPGGQQQQSDRGR